MCNKVLTRSRGLWRVSRKTPIPSIRRQAKTLCEWQIHGWMLFDCWHQNKTSLWSDWRCEKNKLRWSNRSPTRTISVYSGCILAAQPTARHPAALVRLEDSLLIPALWIWLIHHIFVRVIVLLHYLFDFLSAWQAGLARAEKKPTSLQEFSFII